MPKSIHERVRAAQAAAAKARATAERKADEPQRRAAAARAAADVRRDRHIDNLLTGRTDPQTMEDFRILDRADFEV